MKTPIQDKLTEQYPDEPLLFANGFDSAIIGVAGAFDELRVVYSVSKILTTLIKEFRWEGKAEDPDYDWYTEAREHFSFNIGGAYVGSRTPIYVEDDMMEENAGSLF